MRCPVSGGRLLEAPSRQACVCCDCSASGVLWHTIGCLRPYTAAALEEVFSHRSYRNSTLRALLPACHIQRPGFGNTAKILCGRMGVVPCLMAACLPSPTAGLNQRRKPVAPYVSWRVAPRTILYGVACVLDLVGLLLCLLLVIRFVKNLSMGRARADSGQGGSCAGTRDSGNPPSSQQGTSEKATRRLLGQHEALWNHGHPVCGGIRY